MRILLTGASGFAGRYLALRLGREHEVTGTCLSEKAPVPGCRLERLDITDPGAVRLLVKKAAPELVVHAAAISLPDPCERRPEAAWKVNVEGTSAVARAAHEAGARLIHFSTDLVFDGERPPYREEDAPRPAGVYARTKLESERRALALCPRTAVLRLSLGYGWKPAGRPGFCDFIHRELSSGRRVSLFSDQVRTPTYLEDVAEAVSRLAGLERRPGNGEGVFHLAGPERVSRLRFGELFCDVFGLDRGLLVAKRMEEFALDAPRPVDCSLDASKLQRAIAFRSRGVEEGLRAMLTDPLTERVGRLN
ncbi:MAG: SDR family oxidoreductase [Elusimicrobiota bacterium]